MPPGAESVVVPDALSTVGCRGAAGFFKCDVTYSADKAAAATRRAVAPALRMAVPIPDPAGNRRLQKRGAVDRSSDALARDRAQATAADLLTDAADVGPGVA